MHVMTSQSCSPLPVAVLQADGGCALALCTWAYLNACAESLSLNLILKYRTNTTCTQGWSTRLRLQHDASVLRVAHAALAGQAAVQRVAGVQAQPRRGGQHLQRAPARRRPQPRRALRPAAQGSELGMTGFQA